jgi:hypothetical protein
MHVTFPNGPVAVIFSNDHKRGCRMFSHLYFIFDGYKNKYNKSILELYTNYLIIVIVELKCYNIQFIHGGK